MMTADLIARLEAATEGSRELSNEVLLAAGWEYDPRAFTGTEDCAGWHAPSGQMLGRGWIHDGQQPDPTLSLDDAVALVPAGWDHVSLLFGPPGGGWAAEVGDWLMSGKDGPEIRHHSMGLAVTPALALSSAIVKARAQEA